MSRSASVIVTEIKTVYARTTADKLVIQKDMVELRDEHKWNNSKIARETGIPRPTVINWLEAYDEGVNLDTPGRLTPMSVQDASDRRVAKRVLDEATVDQIEAIVESLPAEQVAKIAQAALSKPDIARVIAEDPEATKVVTRASGKVWEEAAAVNRRANRPKKGSVRNVIGFLVEVLGGLNGAKRQLNDSYTAARDHELDDEQREAIEEGLVEIVTIVDWFRSYLASGDQSFEDELEKLLSD